MKLVKDKTKDLRSFMNKIERENKKTASATAKAAANKRQMVGGSAQSWPLCKAILERWPRAPCPTSMRSTALGSSGMPASCLPSASRRRWWTFLAKGPYYAEQKRWLSKNCQEIGMKYTPAEHYGDDGEHHCGAGGRIAEEHYGDDREYHW